MNPDNFMQNKTQWYIQSVFESSLNDYFRMYFVNDFQLCQVQYIMSCMHPVFQKI